MDVANFEDIQQEFIERVHSMVLCNMATVDSQCRPRSRLMHTLWEGPIGWATTYRTSFKARHLARNPYVSLAYIADRTKPVYVDAVAEWMDDLAVKQHVWNLFSHAPPPLGFDPTPIYHSVEDEKFGVLRFIPWRIQLYDETRQTPNRVWRA